MVKYILLLSFLCGVSVAVQQRGNPIRKIITLMQRMQSEVEAEGEKEKELHEKFSCYCKTTEASLTKTIEDANANIDTLSAKLKAESAEKSQITQELTDHKKDRVAAKADLEEATQLRGKEAEEFAAMKADSETNIAAMAAAIPAIEKGMSGAVLLQMPQCHKLKEIVSHATSMDSIDQHDLLAFLEGGSSSDEYSSGAGSGQVLGILKQMKEEFEANLKGAVETEDAALAGFAELKASKEKEIEVATESIETKMVRSGELAVSISQAKDGLEDSTSEVEDTEKALDSLKNQCEAKEKEYSQSKKDRAQEMEALSAAISVLNDDDALALFQKTLPDETVQEGATSFLQRSMTSHHASRAVKAEDVLASVANKFQSPQLNIMLTQLKSKVRLSGTSGTHKFKEIVKMIDDMVKLLAKQQDEDDKQKEWCRGELEKADDEQVAAKTEVERFQTGVEEVTDAIEQLADEIKVIKKQITDLDYTVAEATVQRKEEHSQFQETLTAQEATIALIAKAKKKLEKIYKPALIQKPVQPVPKPVDDADPETLDGFSFVQVKAHSWSLEDATDSSATDTETNTKARERAGKSGGVMKLMDDIIHDTEMAMKDAEFAEKEASNDYAKVMTDAQTQRAQDSKAATDKTAAKADMEAKLVKEKETLAGAQTELLAVGKLIADLHADCDFILMNYDMRKEARLAESDSLKNAKAVLAGAK